MGDERFLSNVFKRFLFLLRFLRFLASFIFFCTFFTSMVETWAGLQHSVVDEATDQWRKRLGACVHAQGGHFEHSL